MLSLERYFEMTSNEVAFVEAFTKFGADVLVLAKGAFVEALVKKNAKNYSFGLNNLVDCIYSLMLKWL